MNPLEIRDVAAQVVALSDQNQTLLNEATEYLQQCLAFARDALPFVSAKIDAKVDGILLFVDAGSSRALWISSYGTLLQGTPSQPPSSNSLEILEPREAVSRFGATKIAGHLKTKLDYHLAQLRERAALLGPPTQEHGHDTSLTSSGGG